MKGDEVKAQGVVKSWLKGKINQLETERSKTFWQNVD
jgi:hypothetical protein